MIRQPGSAYPSLPILASGPPLAPYCGAQAPRKYLGLCSIQQKQQEQRPPAAASSSFVLVPGKRPVWFCPIYGRSGAGIMAWLAQTWPGSGKQAMDREDRTLDLLTNFLLSP